MAGRKKKADITTRAADSEAVKTNGELAIAEELVAEEPVSKDEIICRLTQERRKVTFAEKGIQVLIDQLHREYRVNLAESALSFRFNQLDESLDKIKSLTRKIALVVCWAEVEPRHRKNADIPAWSWS